MNYLILAIYGLIIFFAVVSGIYVGACFAAKRIWNQYWQEPRPEEGERPQARSMAPERRQAGADSEQVVKKRRTTDDSYRILRRRSKESEMEHKEEEDSESV